MRLRILPRPIGTVAGVILDDVRVGSVYELRNDIARVLLAEGWAEIPSLDDEGVAERPPPREISSSGPVVLVVDDEPAVQRLTRMLLTAHGYHVIVAGHGGEAIQQLREQRPDLIVLDLDMPVMDGGQFRSEQRYLTDRKLAAVPVLLMTGEDDAAIHADRLRAVGVIRKPFDPDDLLNAVSAAIGS
jgi:CheY-like chemotaxis protein